MDFDRGEGNKRVRKRNTKSRRKAKEGTALSEERGNENGVVGRRAQEEPVRGGAWGNEVVVDKGGSKGKGKRRARAGDSEDEGDRGDEELALDENTSASLRVSRTQLHLRSSSTTAAPSVSASMTSPSHWPELEEGTRLPSSTYRRPTRSDQARMTIEPSVERGAKRARTGRYYSNQRQEHLEGGTEDSDWRSRGRGNSQSTSPRRDHVPRSARTRASTTASPSHSDSDSDSDSYNRSFKLLHRDPDSDSMEDHVSPGGTITRLPPLVVVQRLVTPPPDPRVEEAARQRRMELFAQDELEDELERDIGLGILGSAAP